MRCTSRLEVFGHPQCCKEVDESGNHLDGDLQHQLSGRDYLRAVQFDHVVRTAAQKGVNLAHLLKEASHIILTNEEGFDVLAELTIRYCSS